MIFHNLYLFLYEIAWVFSLFPLDRNWITMWLLKRPFVNPKLFMSKRKLWMLDLLRFVFSSSYHVEYVLDRGIALRYSKHGRHFSPIIGHVDFSNLLADFDSPIRIQIDIGDYAPFINAMWEFYTHDVLYWDELYGEIQTGGFVTTSITNIKIRFTLTSKTDAMKLKLLL